MVGQLDLFRGTTSRRRKPTPALEFRTCCALATTIDYTIRPGWIYSHLPFGEARSKITGARLKRMGTKPGWPDYAFLGPRGAVLFLEIKRGSLGRLSEAQEQFAEHAETHNHDYACVYSYDQAIAALVERGIIRPS